MGAFADYLEELRGSVAGPVPLGGTLFPTSDFATIPGIVAMGGTFPVPSLEVLADIPYELLLLDMEVVVSEHVRPDTSTHPRTKYFLSALPPENTRVSEVTDYNIGDYWTAVPVGGESDPGDDGDNGWCPQLANEADGPNRVVQKVVGWVGGTGTPPSVPEPPYLGSSGYTTKSAATNIKGAQGDTSTVLVRPQFVATAGEAGETSDGVDESTIGTTEVVIQQVTIQNLWSEARAFLILGECSFKEFGGVFFPRVRIRHKSTNAVVTNTDTILNGTMERVDIGDSPPGAWHKLDVSAIIIVPAGGIQRVGVTAQQVYSDDGYRTPGKITAIGL